MIKTVGRSLGTAARAAEGACPTQLSYLSEQCILVDENDNIRGSASKRDAHTWANVVKGGMLHRAFSVFIFNPQGEMLLQKRAATKITFPNVWTNACCSHPLDRASETASGTGVRTAARRKLAHEFGIAPTDVALGDLVPLARVLYQARCPAPHDAWGEHELDHVFFLTGFAGTLRPNHNEVSDVKFVKESELEAMLRNPCSAFSPWFRLIHGHFLPAWWRKLEDLDSACDYDTIHRFH